MRRQASWRRSRSVRLASLKTTSARRPETRSTIWPFIENKAWEATVVVTRSPFGTAGSGKSNAWKNS